MSTTAVRADEDSLKQNRYFKSDGADVRLQIFGINSISGSTQLKKSPLSFSCRVNEQIASLALTSGVRLRSGC